MDLTENDRSGQGDVPTDQMGAWLQDHEDYLEGRITYDQLKQRNCERYRNSPAICGSGKLTDSQRNRALSRDAEERENARGNERELRYRKARRRAALWSVWTLIGIALLVMLIAMGQWLVAAVMLQPLVGCVFDALKSLHEWRHFDD